MENIKLAAPTFLHRYGCNARGLVRFYRGRFLRIAPLLYVNLIVCLLILPTAEPTPLEALGDFLFVNNLTGRHINTVTWSLSWEMQYYLLAPFVFLWFADVHRKVLYRVLAVALTVELLAGLGV